MGSVVFLLALAHAQPLVAIVVVDQEARETGYAVQIDGWVVEDALPVDVVEGDSVTLIDPDGRTEALDFLPGEAWEITGPDGEAWMSRLDEEVRTDLIVVRGSTESIDALAASLDANVFEEDGQIYLAAPAILLDAPWVEDEAALAIEAVELVHVEPEESETVVDRPASTPITWAPLVPASLPPAAVGSIRTPSGADKATPPAAPEVAAALAEQVAEAGEAEEIPVATTPSIDTLTGLIDREAYAGTHLCRDDVLWLHPSGVYSLRGVSGIWYVGSPGVVRLTAASGEVTFRAAIDPDRGFCRDVWRPEEIGAPTPEAYRAPTHTRRLRGPAR